MTAALKQNFFDIMTLLESMKNLSEKEDWDESRAQAIILDGGELYDKIHATLDAVKE